MALYCNQSQDVVAQHLFLGSSIISYSSNMGWGGAKGSLTVDLADDYGCSRLGEISSDPLADIFVCSPFNTKCESYNTDNHYYDCNGNDCYMDENGDEYNPDRPPNDNRGRAPERPPSNHRVVPGKVYHIVSSDGLTQRYWKKNDPGFFGNATRINKEGQFVANSLWRYNLINTPVYFRFGYFTFGGIITGWECTNRIGTPSYSVIISSADDILDKCKVILSKFGGAIFSSFPNSGKIGGGPSNYYGTLAGHTGTYGAGNLPNVFNVYGFLESYGFGTSNANDQGVPLAYIINSLSVLTSTVDGFSEGFSNVMSTIWPTYNGISTTNLGPFNAFSPYGRIIAPSLLTDNNINPENAFLGDNGFGIIPPTADAAGVPRVEFLLDLSELPRPPLDIRYNGNNGVASISDIIGEVCKKTGRDWYTTIIRKNGYNIIKIKTIDRTIALPSNTIESVVRSIEQSNIKVSTSSFGKEKDPQATPRVMIMGANQHRLYQTKSMLLGYSNTHLVYHPMLKKFVDYYRFGKTTSQEIEVYNRATGRREMVEFKIQKSEKWVDAFKIPLAYSVRNLTISSYVNTPIVTTLFAGEQNLGERFGNAKDAGFTDTTVGGFASPLVGNYWPSSNLKMNVKMVNQNDYDKAAAEFAALDEETRKKISCGAPAEGLENTIKEQRYIPLWSTAISPFFGYAHDQTLEFSDVGNKTNFYRMIRPVYLDTWTGLLVIGFRPNEMPPLIRGLLPNLYATRFGKTGDPTLSDTGVGIQGGMNPGGAEGNPGDRPRPFNPDDPNDPDEEQINNFGSLEGEPGVDPFEYNNPGNGLNRIGFVVTETELRAAAEGWESYLHYCIMKLSFSKPDLFVQLVSVYKSEGKLFINRVGAVDPVNDDPGQGMGGGDVPGAGVNVALGHDVWEWRDVPGQEFENLNYNFNWVLNHDFITDIKTIANYLAGIHNKYYGLKYIVRVPEILAYKDLQYSDIRIPMSQLYDTAKTSYLNQQTIRNTINQIISNDPKEIAASILENYGMIIPESVIAAELKAMGRPLAEGWRQPKETTDTSNVYQDFGGTGLVDHKNTIVVYQGSGKIFFNYEPANDGAWEEPGNFIDDSVLIGGLDYYKLCKSDGKIGPILGYNANINKDYVAEAWCNLDTPSRVARWLRATGRRQALEEQMRGFEDFGLAVPEDLIRAHSWRVAQINQLGRYPNNCSQLTVPSLDLSSVADSEYVMINVSDSGREDAFSNRIVGKRVILNLKDQWVDASAPIPQTNNQGPPQKVGEDEKFISETDALSEPYFIAPDEGSIPIPTTKVYFLQEIEGDILFLDPINFIGPRVVLTAPGVDLYFTSTAYQNDPNNTVINNAVTEDYAILKRMQAGAFFSVKQSQFLTFFILRVARNMLFRLNGNQFIDNILRRLGANGQAFINLLERLGVPANEIIARIREFAGDVKTTEVATVETVDKEFGLSCEQVLNEIFAMLESRIIGLKPNPNAQEDDPSTAFIASPNLDAWFLHSEPVSNNVSTKHRRIKPRKANPMFAAVPLKDNTSCYGPWTNYPILADSRVYPGVANRINAIEQMINNVDVEKDDDLAPWNYGGMAFLDREIINRIDSTATYQLVTENGAISTPGSPPFIISNGLHIGSTEYDVHQYNTRTFMGHTYSVVTQQPYVYSYAGLTVSSVSTYVTDRNIATTYRFQTYAPRLGLFSKENTDRNKEISKKSIEIANKISISQRNLEQKLRAYIDANMNSRRSDRSNFSGNDARADLFGNSPIQLLAGAASYFMFGGGIPTSNDPGCGSDSFDMKYDQEKTIEANTETLSSFLGSEYKTKSIYTRNSARTHNWVGAFQTREALAELTYNHQSKAIMSLDGIFSPVSFYPTTNLGTYPISSRFITQELETSNVTCPLCLGTKLYTHYVDDKEIDHPCPLCNKPRTIFPSGEELDIDKAPDINFLSLNPIVVPHGDFINPNSQLNFNLFERSRHNIRIVGRQEDPQVGYQALEITANIDSPADIDTGASKDEYINAGTVINTARSVNADYYKYDVNYFDPTKQNKKILLNQRFFAFRGPMMLHGWGYDTDGYPVPNQADEPGKFDDEGRPLRFKLTSSGTNDYESDGAYLPTSGYYLGDVIGNGWTKEDGKWKKQRTRFFHLNWAERSDLWPIGPIDLRWDSERKVWTAGEGCSELDPPFIIASGTTSETLNLLKKFVSKTESTKKEKCPYKMVYTVLEENLTKVDGLDQTHPARGFLDDLEYGLTTFKTGSPLINNSRKLIYIKDRCGYTAPRGAKLLCRYDKDSGFYEPVTKQQYIVFGNITDGNNAIIDLTYIQGIKSPENIPKINITFDNTRFNFLLFGKKRGMFMYENGKWILIGTN